MDAIYARQSIEKKDSLSIEAQTELCRHECTGKPLEFKDPGFSGKTINRPDFKKLLAAIEHGEVHKVVVYKLDRISRSVVDFGRIWEVFDKHHVAFVSVNEKLDTSTPVGRAMIYIIMVFAQLERETTAERITDSYRFRSKLGLFMGGNTPFGYTSKRITLDGKTASILEIDPDTSPYIKSIFDWYIGGYNTSQIAHIFNDMKVKSYTGKTFSGLTILRILKNVAYCQNDVELFEHLFDRGYHVINSVSDFNGLHGMGSFFKNKGRHTENDISEHVICVGMHEPIIDCQTWILAQNRIEAAKQTPRSSKHSAKSRLAGYLKCAHCGHSFGLRTTSKGDKVYNYYSCRGRLARGDSTCDNGTWISADEIENYVEKELKKRTSKLAGTSEIKIKKASANPEAIRLKQELHDKRDQIGKIVDAIGKGNAVVDKLLTERITALNNECETLSDKIKELGSFDYLDWKRSSEQIARLSAGFDNLFLNADVIGRNKFIKDFIEKIEIDSEGKVNIYWHV